MQSRNLRTAAQDKDSRTATKPSSNGSTTVTDADRVDEGRAIVIGGTQARNVVRKAVLAANIETIKRTPGSPTSRNTVARSTHQRTWIQRQTTPTTNSEGYHLEPPSRQGAVMERTGRPYSKERERSENKSTPRGILDTPKGEPIPDTAQRSTYTTTAERSQQIAVTTHIDAQ